MELSETLLPLPPHPMLDIHRSQSVGLPNRVDFFDGGGGGGVGGGGAQGGPGKVDAFRRRERKSNARRTKAQITMTSPRRISRTSDGIINSKRTTTTRRADPSHLPLGTEADPKLPYPWPTKNTTITPPPVVSQSVALNEHHHQQQPEIKRTNDQEEKENKEEEEEKKKKGPQRNGSPFRQRIGPHKPGWRKVRNMRDALGREEGARLVARRAAALEPRFPGDDDDDDARKHGGGKGKSKGSRVKDLAADGSHVATVHELRRAMPWKYWPSEEIVIEWGLVGGGYQPRIQSSKSSTVFTFGEAEGDGAGTRQGGRYGGSFPDGVGCEDLKAILESWGPPKHQDYMRRLHQLKSRDRNQVLDAFWEADEIVQGLPRWGETTKRVRDHRIGGHEPGKRQGACEAYGAYGGEAVEKVSSVSSLPEDPAVQGALDEANEQEYEDDLYTRYRSERLRRRKEGRLTPRTKGYLVRKYHGGDLGAAGDSLHGERHGVSDNGLVTVDEASFLILPNLDAPLAAHHNGQGTFRERFSKTRLYGQPETGTKDLRITIPDSSMHRICRVSHPDITDGEMSLANHLSKKLMAFSPYYVPHHHK